MCGIVYSKSFNGRNVNDTILTRFEHQRSRGTTSFGYYLPMTDRLTHNVKESRIKALLKKTENEEVLFHHRKSTSTIDVRNACHPFTTKDHFDYEYIGVHNGVLRNEKSLREEHEKLGIKYVSIQENNTFNDSEALIYDLARYFEGQTDKVHAEGRVAFIMVKRDSSGKPLTLFFGHNTVTSPLVMKKTEFSLTISSLGEGDTVPIDVLHMWDYETKELRTAPMPIGLGYSYNTNNHHNYTPNRGTATTGTNLKSKSKVYNSWDDFADDFQAGAYSREQQEELLALKAQMDNEMFNMRVGDMKEIRKELLKENKGDYAKAALMAILEAEEAAREVALVGNWIAKVADDEDTKNSLIAYAMDLSKYRKEIEKIAEDFNMESRTVTDKEEEPREVLGFHQSPANKRLSPSSVLRNNQSISE